MKTTPYKYDFKYRIEKSDKGWCVKRLNLIWWSVIKDGIENEAAAYFYVEQIEAVERDELIRRCI